MKGWEIVSMYIVRYDDISNYHWHFSFRKGLYLLNILFQNFTLFFIAIRYLYVCAKHICRHWVELSYSSRSFLSFLLSLFSLFSHSHSIHSTWFSAMLFRLCMKVKKVYSFFIFISFHSLRLYFMTSSCCFDFLPRSFTFMISFSSFCSFFIFTFCGFSSLISSLFYRHFLMIRMIFGRQIL